MRRIARFAVWLLPLGMIIRFTPVPYAMAKTLLVYGSGALLVVAVKDASRLASVLRNPVMMYLGRISYGIYLLHEIVFGVLRKTHLHASLVARHSLALARVYRCRVRHCDRTRERVLLSLRAADSLAQALLRSIPRAECVAENLYIAVGRRNR